MERDNEGQKLEAKDEKEKYNTFDSKHDRLSKNDSHSNDPFTTHSQSGAGKNIVENILPENNLSEDALPENASKAFETILYKVGDYHKYQWKLMFISGVCGFFTALHNMGAVFLAASPDHWCNVQYFKENNITIQRSDLNITAPWVKGKDGVLEHSKCQYYDYDYKAVINQGYFPINSTPDALLDLVHLSPAETKSCDSWVYDDQIYKSTVVSEWDLVCGDKWMMSSTQASYMMGILTGAVVFSAVSDKIGRRPASLICCCLFFIASVSAAFTSSFVLFLVLRFIVAGAGQGMFLVNFISLMETVSLKGRNVMGNLFHIFFSIGFVFLVLIAYLIRDWRDLQLGISVPTILLLAYFWVLPESPRWLIMHGRQDEALEIFKNIAKCNNKKFPSDEELKPLLVIISDEVEHKVTYTFTEKIKSVLGSVVTLVRTPNMRKRNIIVFYAWFVTSMVYYGLSFSGAAINASVYLTVLLGALIEFPSGFATILLLFRFGRRTVLSANFLLGGAALIAVLFVPTEMVGLNLALTTLGKFSISATFLVVFMLSAELVPTHVRNISIGMASMFARIGSGIAPFIVDLLGDVYYAIPFIIFGVLAVVAGLLSLLLPETGKKRLPESIEEIEAMPR